MKLRRFNAEGMHEFKQALARCREQPETEIRNGLLENVAFTEIVKPEVQIAEQQFVTKEEVANYLRTILKPFKVEEVENDAELWSWLALLFFDSICRTNKIGRVVRNDYHYIFEPRNNRHFYRHLVFLPWRILQLAPFHNRLFLKSRCDTLDKVNTQVMSRLFLTRIPCIFNVLDRLYWDDERGRARSGITMPEVRAGDLTHRLATRVLQLEKTFDLMSLDADQLIELLGEEFAFARPASRAKTENIFAGAQ